jgi:hypothetical protein
MRKVLLLALAACVIPTSVFAAGQYVDPNVPAASPSTDGGINTGTGTVPKRDAMDYPADNSPSAGDNIQSGGINSGPGSSLSNTGVIPPSPAR